jgi:hypothetical protein
VVATWKPMGKFAELLAQPAPTAAQLHPMYHPQYGFGAKGADRPYTPPTERPIPVDWWKRDTHYT